MGMHVSLYYDDFNSFRMLPRRAISGSKGISSFKLLRNLHFDFHGSHTSLHFHQQCKSVSFPLKPQEEWCLNTFPLLCKGVPRRHWEREAVLSTSALLLVDIAQATADRERKTPYLVMQQPEAGWEGVTRLPPNTFVVLSQKASPGFQQPKAWPHWLCWGNARGTPWEALHGSSRCQGLLAKEHTGANI